MLHDRKKYSFFFWTQRQASLSTLRFTVLHNDSACSASGSLWKMPDSNRVARISHPNICGSFIENPNVKWKISQNRFSLFKWGLGRIFFCKRRVKNLVTLPFKTIHRYWLFFQMWQNLATAWPIRVKKILLFSSTEMYFSLLGNADNNLVWSRIFSDCREINDCQFLLQTTSRCFAG